MAKPKKKITTVTETLESENENEFSENENNDPAEKGDRIWEQELSEWAAESHGENEIARFQIFRNRKPPATGIEQVFEYENQYIRKHQIGLMYGSGSYMVEMNLPAKNGKPRVFRRRFTLSIEYDRARKIWIAENDAELLGAPGAVASSAPPARSDLDIALVLIRELRPMFEKFMGGRANENPSAANHWRETQSLVGDVVRESASTQIRLLGDLRKELSGMNANPAPPVNEDQATETEFKDFVKGIFREYGKDIIDATGLKLKAIAAKLRGDEIFQTLTQNPALYKRVFDLLVIDPELDKTPNFTREILGKILDKLGKMNLGVNIPTLPASVNGSRPVNIPH